MKKKMQYFFSSPYYIGLIFVVSVLCWTFYQLNVGVIFLLVMASIVLIFDLDTETLFPLIFNGCFICRSYISNNTTPIILFIGSAIFALLLVVYFIRKKPKISKTKMKYSFLFLAISSVISLINLNAQNDVLRYVYSAINVLFLLYYLFFASTGKNNKGIFLAMSLIGAALLVSCEFLIEGLTHDGFEEKIITLGWGGGNTMAIYVNIGIIASFYLLTVSMKWYKELLNFILIAFFIFVMLLSLCRAGYVALLVCIGPCIFLSIKYSKNRKLTSIFYISSVVVLSILFLIFNDKLINYIDLAFKKGMNDNGRFDMWNYALKKFYKHPIIGNGLFNKDVINCPDSARLSVMHNFIVQCLFSFGLVGLFALFYFYYEKCKLIFKDKMTIFKWFFIIISISGFIHGMFDNTFYMGVYMAFLTSIISVVEHERFADEDISIEKYNENQYGYQLDE